MNVHRFQPLAGGLALLLAVGTAGVAWAQAAAVPSAVVSRNPYLPPAPGSGANPYAPRPYQVPTSATGRNPYLPNPAGTTVNPYPGFKQNLTSSAGALTGGTPPSGDDGGTVAGGWPVAGVASTVHPREVSIRGGNGELRRGSLGSVVFFDGAPYRLEGWSGNALLVRSERSRETIRLLPGDGRDGTGVYQFSTGANRQPSFSNPLTNPTQKEGPPKSSAPAYWNLNGHGGGG